MVQADPLKHLNPAKTPTKATKKADSKQFSKKGDVNTRLGFPPQLDFFNLLDISKTICLFLNIHV